MIVKIALPLILAFIMFSLGLGLKPGDFGRVLKQPKAFGIGLLNQVVLLPLIAFALAVVFQLPPELAVGVMILALCLQTLPRPARRRPSPRAGCE